MTETTNYEETFFERAASTLKIHGIIAIIFGSLGVFFGVMFMLLMAIGGLAASYQLDDALGVFALGLFAFVLWVLPHAYLIISGIQLTRQPDPKVAKVLVIINLIVGVLWNLVLLVFAIINLTQMGDYERGYKKYALKK